MKLPFWVWFDVVLVVSSCSVWANIFGSQPRSNLAVLLWSSQWLRWLTTLYSSVRPAGTLLTTSAVNLLSAVWLAESSLTSMLLPLEVYGVQAGWLEVNGVQAGGLVFKLADWCLSWLIGVCSDDFGGQRLVRPACTLLRTSAVNLLSAVWSAESSLTLLLLPLEVYGVQVGWLEVNSVQAGWLVFMLIDWQCCSTDFGSQRFSAVPVCWVVVDINVVTSDGLRCSSWLIRVAVPTTLAVNVL
jgi:hypothetical protein